MTAIRHCPLLVLLLLAAVASAAEITGFTLVNADSNADIGPLVNGATIDLSSVGSNLNVRAGTSGTLSKVNFSLSGAMSHSQSEGVAPYALYGDSSGNYNAWTPVVGSYSLSANADGSGALSVSFSVTDGGGGSDPVPDPSGSNGDGSITIGGERKQWHRVDLSQAAIHSSETASTNPFLDYRFNVAFTAPSGKVYLVPGYFATDGAGGDSGNVWRAHLNPHETGTWTYAVSFRQGSNVAVSLSATAGSAVSPFDGKTGSFSVGSSDKSGSDFRAADKGMLVNRGHHYLTYGGSGKPFLYTGPGIPENILGYRGFTNTTVGIGHEFTAHGKHWTSGDPDWDGGKGKNLIGALNYIANQGANCLYMMSNTLGGDGKDCFPTISTSSKDRYDLLKLQQWDIALAHAQAKGIFLHWHLAENESANMLWYGSATSVERKLYFRMLNARFGHYNGLKWNIMEETEWSAVDRDAQMDYIHAVDPYDHPVTYQVGGAGIAYSTYDAHLGDPDIDAGSFQGSASRGSMFDTIGTWRQKSAAAGEPWTCAWDEPQKIENDNTDDVNGYPMGRRDKMWPCLMGGGDGFMWYIQADGGGHGFDQRIEDFTIMQNAFNWSGHIRTFLAPLPLLAMTPSRSVVTSSTGEDYTLYQAGQVYAIFNDRAGSGMSLNLSGVSGTFDVRWFDPRIGGALKTGTVSSISGGGLRSLGNAPSNTGLDWAVLVTKSGSTPSNQPPVADASATPTSGTAPLVVNFSSAGSSDSDGSIVSRSWSFGDGSSSTTANPSHSYSSAGTYTATLTVTDDDGAKDSDSVTITVSAVPTAGQSPYGGSALAIASSGTTRIQAENYDLGGEGVAYHDTASSNQGGQYRSDGVDIQVTSDTGGGYNVGWIAAGEWLEYSIDVATAGSYLVDLRVARQTTGSAALHLAVAGQNLSGSVTVPSTGGWQTWTTVSTEIQLEAGKQVLRLAMDQSSFNVNWLELSSSGGSTGGVLVAAINAGGAGFTAADGTAYVADGSVSGGKTYSTTAAIAGTGDDKLYQSERYGSFSYALPVSNGDYLLTLHFAEIYFTANGKRIFDVSVEGSQVISNLDLHAVTGARYVAHDVVIPVTVSDGVLNIGFSPDVDNAKLSALRLETAGATSN